MDAETQIRRGDTVARFLEDPTIQSVIEERSNRYYQEWKASTDPQARERIWAQSRALEDLLVAFQATIDSSDRAKYEVQRDNHTV